MIQLSIFDTPEAPTPRCKDCGEALNTYRGTELPLNGLCATCLRARPRRADGSYLTARIYPHDWRDDPVWAGGKSFPLYYQDEAGTVWQKKHDVSGEYVRWE
jgi:hypothetical protein